MNVSGQRRRTTHFPPTAFYPEHRANDASRSVILRRVPRDRRTFRRRRQKSDHQDNHRVCLQRWLPPAGRSCGRARRRRTESSSGGCPGPKLHFEDSPDAENGKSPDNKTDFVARNICTHPNTQADTYLAPKALQDAQSASDVGKDGREDSCGRLGCVPA